MGGHNFETYALGKDAADAYSKAYDRALYEHGHDPYNGTISTTHGFVPLTVPGVKSRDLIDIVWQLEYTPDAFDQAPARLRSGAQDWERRNKEKERRLYGIWQRLPWKDRQAVKQAASMIEKWGDCVAVELTGSELTAARKTYGPKVYKDGQWQSKRTYDKVFVFIGIAAS